MILKNKRFDDSRVFISFELLTQCNYRCSYCYMFRNPENANLLASNDFHDENQHSVNLKILEKLKLIDKKIHLFLLGGEPTIYKKLFEILDKAYEIPDIIVEIVSNGKRFEDIEFTKKFIRYQNLQITVSMHYEYLETTDYLKIFNNFKILKRDIPNQDDRFILYSLLPKNPKDFYELEKKHKIINILEKIKSKNRVFLSLVDGYNIELLTDTVQEYINYFNSINKNHLIEFEFVRGITNNNAHEINRFKFLEMNSLNKVHYIWCYFNNYLIDKNGDIVGGNCEALDYLNVNILTSSEEEIKNILNINLIQCPYKKCSINCSLVTKRKIKIDEDCDNFLLN